LSPAIRPGFAGLRETIIVHRRFEVPAIGRQLHYCIQQYRLKPEELSHFGTKRI
jgi:hypothetical protein